MAYVAFAENAAPATSPVPMAARPPRFSALEWSVVMLAAKDRVSSLREPGKLSVALGRLFGERVNPRLADPQLEALRKMAVLTWHHGYSVPTAAIKRFVAAGFSNDQYELLADSVGAARLRNQRKMA